MKNICRIAGNTLFGAIIAVLLSVNSAPAAAQEPCDNLNLSDITFVRQNFGRNFYNSCKVMSCLNMDGTDLFLPNSANLIISGSNTAELKQEGRNLRFTATSPSSSTIVRVSSFHPYLCYDAAFSEVGSNSKVGICFCENGAFKEDGGKSAASLSILYEDGKIVARAHGIEGEKDGVIGSVEVSKTETPFIRIQYTGRRFHIFWADDASKTPVFQKSIRCDMRSAQTPLKWSFGVCAELDGGSICLNKAQSALTCGTGQADPQIVQHKNGTPIIRDGRLYVCMTTRGFQDIPDSYQGVYSIDLDSYELRLEGALFFGDGDGRMYGYHATKVVYDDDARKYLVLTTTHGGTHTLAWSETDADILHGMHYLECRELDYPHNMARGGVKPGKNETIAGTEDPDFFYDSKAKKWRLVYCARQGASKDGQHLSYVTHLCESKTWNGSYKLIATSKEDNNTGIRITTVGGRRYVLSGGSDTTFYIYDYPTLEYVGTFAQEFPNGGFRGWPTIVPLPYGNYERYLWITFDRGALTGRYSYGTMYYYLGDKMWRR